ncbi:MAG: DMT family transporter [Alicyclobacillaceae bacterium]|nr:DMT family transporter [Alicyclobacillaceae bacterium]
MSRWKSVVLVAFLVFVWGVSWAIYKVALHYTPPVLFAGMRTLLGGLVLAIVAVSMKRPIRLRACWHIYLVSSFFNAMLFFGLQTVGLTYLPEGLFSVLVYLQPVLVSVLAWLWLNESLPAGKIAGLICGLAGVAVTSSGSFSGALSWTGVMLGLATGLSWAFGTVYLKRNEGRVDLIWLVSIQFMLGGSILTSIGIGVESWASIVWNGVYVFALIFGGLFGVAATWITWFTLLQSGEASKVSASTFLVPLVAVSSGCLFLHEPVTWRLLVGLVCIAVSIFLVNRRSRQPAAPRQTAPSVNS